MLVNDDCYGVFLCRSYDVQKSVAQGVRRRSLSRSQRESMHISSEYVPFAKARTSCSPSMTVTMCNNMLLMLRKKWSCLSTMTATVSSYAVAMMCKNSSLRVCGEEVCPARKERVCTFPPNMSRLLRQERPALRR